MLYFLIGLLIALVIHEVGHSIVPLLRGYKVIFNIGEDGDREKGFFRDRIKVRWNSSLLVSSWSCMVPISQGVSTIEWVLMLLMGPGSNIIAFVVCLGIHKATGSGPIYEIGLANLMLGLYNLFPGYDVNSNRPNKLYRTDGRLILDGISALCQRDKKWIPLPYENKEGAWITQMKKGFLAYLGTSRMLGFLLIVVINSVFIEGEPFAVFRLEGGLQSIPTILLVYFAGGLVSWLYLRLRMARMEPPV